MTLEWSVGYVSDECDMGYSDCTPDWNNDNGEFGRLAVQQSYVDQFRPIGTAAFYRRTSATAHCAHSGHLTLWMTTSS